MYQYAVYMFTPDPFWLQLTGVAVVATVLELSISKLENKEYVIEDDQDEAEDEDLDHNIRGNVNFVIYSGLRSLRILSCDI